MKADGTRPRQITPVGLSAFSAQWSPNDHLIAFSRGRQPQAWVIRACPAHSAQLLARNLPVTPATLLTWHRKLAASKYDTSNRRKPSLPPTVPSIARLVVRLAKENPLWGYRRIHGEIAELGVTVAPSTVWRSCAMRHRSGSPPRSPTAGGSSCAPRRPDPRRRLCG